MRSDKEISIKKAGLGVMVLLALLAFTIALPAPSFADTNITGQRTTLYNFSLLEYSGYRTGTLTIYSIAKSTPAPPYGYPYDISVNVNSVCSSTEFLTGGSIDGWLNTVLFPSDLAAYGVYNYAEAGVVPFGSAYNDGSSGVYYPCGMSPFYVNQGVMYVAFYTASLYDQYSGMYIVGDLYVCDDSNGYNCNEYYIYSSYSLF